MTRFQKFFIVFLFFCFLLSIAWTIVGSVWFFGDDDCRDDFEVGYFLIWILLASNYTGFVYRVVEICYFLIAKNNKKRLVN